MGSENGNGNGNGGDSVFFHMKGMASGSDFSALHSGDEVEFLLVTNTKAKKNSAIHVKKLRYVCVCVCVPGIKCACMYGFRCTNAWAGVYQFWLIYVLAVCSN